MHFSILVWDFFPLLHSLEGHFRNLYSNSQKHLVIPKLCELHASLQPFLPGSPRHINILITGSVPELYLCPFQPSFRQTEQADSLSFFSEMLHFLDHCNSPLCTLCSNLHASFLSMGNQNLCCISDSVSPVLCVVALIFSSCYQRYYR